MSRCGNVVELCELHELPRQAPVGGTLAILMGGPHDEAAQHQPVTMTSSRWPSVARISGGGLFRLVLANRVCGGSSSASRSFVLAALRALHLDPDCRSTATRHMAGTRPNNEND